jgi:hypothetical protein
LLKTLAARGVRVADVANVMQLGDDTRRATRLVQSLERDGLVVVDGEWCRLP